MNSFKSLEVRHIKAMEQVAKLTLEKEQLEYIIGRLQDETGIMQVIKLLDLFTAGHYRDCW